MAKPITAHLHQLDGFDFEYIPADECQYLKPRAPWQASALNAAIAALRPWEDRSDRAYVGAALARLLLRWPDLQSFTARLTVCADVDDEGVVRGETAVAVVDGASVRVACAAASATADEADADDALLSNKLMRSKLEMDLDDVGCQLTRVVMYQPRSFRMCRVVRSPYGIEIDVRRDRVQTLLRAERISGLSVFQALFT